MILVDAREADLVVCMYRKMFSGLTQRREAEGGPDEAEESI